MRLCKGKGREALPHTPLRKLFGEKFPKDLQKLSTGEVVAQQCKKRKFRKKYCCHVKTVIPDASDGTPPAGCRFHYRAPAPVFSGSGLRGCGVAGMRGCGSCGYGDGSVKPAVFSCRIAFFQKTIAKEREMWYNTPENMVFKTGKAESYAKIPELSS